MSILPTFGYTGGKSKAVKKILNYLPDDWQEYREPFIGGGWIAVNVMRRYPERKYWINDKYYPTYCIWKTLKEDPEWLVKQLLDYKYSFGLEAMHYYVRETLNDPKDHPYETGVKALIALKTNYGAKYIAPFSPSARRITDVSFINLLDVGEVLRKVNVTITNVDYAKLLNSDGNNVVVYADPPYDLGRYDMYPGHREFDHELLAERLKECKHKWLLSYNDREQIRWRYAEYNQVAFSMSYGLTGEWANRRGYELLIANYDLWKEFSLLEAVVNEHEEEAED